ncbi:hypothetical protein PAPYR_3373 [Paratrimastix pyriformis]|uniref:CSC1/OSCA1-like 7TM region domain-containing protein n=1 Tax=Paratrimastix pyriformis TaxID=342808 RepID=A0ABQ8UNI0_9EUKA|nr:hypothetical protein PAPYR_3373 [Paratrimastix pyriformis]
MIPYCRPFFKRPDSPRFVKRGRIFERWHGCLGYALSPFFVGDDQIASQLGLNTVVYFYFLRWAIVILLVYTVVSCAVFLPLNLSGGVDSSARSRTWGNRRCFGSQRVFVWPSGASLVFPLFFLSVLSHDVFSQRSKIRAVIHEFFRHPEWMRSNRHTLKLWPIPATVSSTQLRAAIENQFPSVQIEWVRVVPAGLEAPLAILEQKRVLQETILRATTRSPSAVSGPASVPSASPTSPRFLPVTESPASELSPAFVQPQEAQPRVTVLVSPPHPHLQPPPPPPTRPDSHRVNPLRYVIGFPFLFCFCCQPRQLRGQKNDDQETTTLQRRLVGVELDLQQTYHALSRTVAAVHLGSPPTLGVAYLHFAGHDDALVVVKRRAFTGSAKPLSLRLGPQRRSHRISVEYAGLDPADPIWGNMGVPHGIGKFLRYAFVVTVMFFFIFFWNIPVAFLANIDNLASLPVIGPFMKWILGLSNFARGLLVAYLPSLMLLVFSLLLIPLLEKITSFLGHDSRSRRRLSFLSLYLLWMTMNVLFVPALISAATSIVALFSLNFDRAIQVISAILSSAGRVVFAFVIQYSLLWNFARFLRLFQYIWELLLTLYRLASLVPMPLSMPSPFSLSEVFALETSYCEAMLILGIALILAPAIPLIVPTCLLFFVLRLLFDRWQLVSIAMSQPPTNHSHVRRVNSAPSLMLSSPSLLTPTPGPGSSSQQAPLPQSPVSLQSVSSAQSDISPPSSVSEGTPAPALDRFAPKFSRSLQLPPEQRRTAPVLDGVESGFDFSLLFWVGIFTLCYLGAAGLSLGAFLLGNYGVVMGIITMALGLAMPAFSCGYLVWLRATHHLGIPNEPPAHRKGEHRVHHHRRPDEPPECDCAALRRMAQQSFIHPVEKDILARLALLRTQAQQR